MAVTVLKPHKNGFIVRRDRSLLLSLTASLIALVFVMLTAVVFYVSLIDVKLTELECSAENDLCVLKHSNGIDFRIEDLNSASVRTTASVDYFGSPIELSVLYLNLDNGQSVPLCSTQLNHPSVPHLNREAEKVNHFLSDPEAISVSVSCR